MRSPFHVNVVSAIGWYYVANMQTPQVLLRKTWRMFLPATYFQLTVKKLRRYIRMPSADWAFCVANSPVCYPVQSRTHHIAWKCWHHHHPVVRHRYLMSDMTCQHSAYKNNSVSSTAYLCQNFIETFSFKGPKNMSFCDCEFDGSNSLSALDCSVMKQEWRSYLRH